jgi:hypothetical protein
MIDLSSTLGMCEMESAASRIVELCQTYGAWSKGIRYEDMHQRDGYDSHERNGFLCLIYNGWLRMGYLKGIFFVNDKLIERIKDKLPTEMQSWVYDDTAGWLYPELDDPYHLRTHVAKGKL